MVFNNVKFSDSPRYKHYKVLHWTSWFASTIGIILVLVARGHYTVDVLIAYYVTTRTFWIYHTLANNTYLKVCVNLWFYYKKTEQNFYLVRP